MKCLIVVRTYYSLMVAINLAMTNLKEHDVDLLITDSCEKNYSLSQNLKKEKIFRNIFFVESKNFEIKEKLGYLRNKLRLFRRYINFIVFGNKYIQKFCDINDRYDKLLVFQVNIDLELCIYKYCLYKNRNIQLCLYEEAYLSYFADKGALKIFTEDIIDRLSFLLLLPQMRLMVTEAFYFYPENVQYKPNFKLTKMKSFVDNRKALLPVLNRIFSYNYQEKSYNYIYVEDSYHEQGIDIGDEEVINNLFNLLGSSMVIKLHPRTKNNRFSFKGFPVMKRNDIPLELYALNEPNQIKLISMYSSGIISTALCNSNSLAFFVYPCNSKGIVLDKMKNRLEKIVKLFPKQCKIISDVNEVISL